MKQGKTRKHETAGLRTWIEIDTAALKHNYQLFRRTIGKKVKLMAVTKSNAYGHDLFQFSKLMEALGVDWLAVDSIIEGIALRREGIEKPILVLGYTLPEKFSEAAANNISLTISTFENLALLKKIPVKFHLKIDTGMHRQGFLPSQIPEVLSKLRSYKLEARSFEGIYTHFAAAKNPAFPKDTLKQVEEFNQVIKLVGEVFPEQIKRIIKHAAATSGTFLFPESHFDLVRIGIGMYGLWPSPEVAAARSAQFPLCPALTWTTIISEIKNLPAGSGIGYDLTEKLNRDSTIGICPIGYWHGYPRLLSSIGHVLVHGQRARVLGRVSMDMITIDLTKIKNARVGDELILLGQSGQETISADEFALLSQTTNYEIVTRLNPLIKKIYK